MNTIENLDRTADAAIITIKTSINDIKNHMTDILNIKSECNKKMEDITKRENDLNIRERQLIENEHIYQSRMGQLEVKEKILEREQEDGRKVSILKNLQIQLSQKSSECELLQKQLKIYKSRSEIVTVICNKYNLHIENFNLDVLEKNIILNVSTVEPKIEELNVNTVQPKIEELKIETPVSEPKELSMEDSVESTNEEDGI
jgi:hypothetical protein